MTFVGTLSGGSSYSSSGTSAPRASSSKPSSAADGMGISLLDDEDGQQMHDGFHAMQVEEQVLKNVFYFTSWLIQFEKVLILLLCDFYFS